MTIYDSSHTTHCIVCKEPLVLDCRTRQKKYCSHVCANKVQQNNSYQAQKKRAFLRKKYYVQLLGGSCNICGYKINYSGLCFHHKEPDKKSFSLDARTLSNTTEDKILEEINKCQLLCLNCHAEIHNPELTMP
jgi:hypothetical protein